MKCHLYSRIARVLALTIIVFNSNCNNSANSENLDQELNTVSKNPDVDTSPTHHNSELKVGGLYLSKNKDGRYSVSKILAVDDFAVHVRLYADEFDIKPTQISSTNLKVMIGHAPLDAKGFLADNPELLKIEDVKDSELEGYKIYLEEMKK